MNAQQQLREHVLYLLRSGGAHLSFEQAIANLPPDMRGAKPVNIPHTPWRLLEHIRICQWDILEYSRNPQHVSPEWPDGYWPEGDSPTEEAWDNTIMKFKEDLQAMQALVADPGVDLLTPIPHGHDGHTVLREALLVADHNAYHLGQLVVVRRALDAWCE